MNEQIKIAEENGDFCDIRTYCDDRNILNYPAYLNKTQKMKDGQPVFLSNGEIKMEKKLCINKQNPNKFPRKGYHIFLEENAEDIMKRRWDEYRKNPKAYNILVRDTSKDGVVDVDCDLEKNKIVDGKENPIRELLKTQPFTKSSSKSFGCHIFIEGGIDLGKDKQGKVIGGGAKKLRAKFGIDSSGQRGVEYLYNFNCWSPLNTKVYFPKRPLKTKNFHIKKEIFMAQIENDKKKKLPKNQPSLTQSLSAITPTAKKKKKKTIKAKQSQTPEAGESKNPENTKVSNIDYELLRKNLMNYSPEHISDTQKAAGIILSCASSQDEKVYEIVLELMKRPNSNWGGEAWVRERWDSYNHVKHATYTIDKYLTTWIKPLSTTMVTNESAGKRFLLEHQHNFVFNKKFKKKKYNICYFDEKTCMWEDSETEVPSHIINHLSDEIQNSFIKHKFNEEFWKDKDDKQIKNYKKELLKFQNDSFLNSTASWLKHKLKKNKIFIDFNQHVGTYHLFQFNNGAFNLRTQKLEERKREHYVTECLDYEYRDADESIKEKMKYVKKIIKMIIPEKKDYECFMLWRAYCLTGFNEGKLFLILNGFGSNNGKSTVADLSKICFPIYVKQIGDDVFDKGSEGSRSFNKHFSNLVGTAIRFVYQAEVGASKVDTERFKSCQDVGQFQVQPLYCSAVDLRSPKLECGTNAFDPKIDGKDTGFTNRFNMYQAKSTFVSSADDVKEDKHIYKKDTNLKTKFQKDDDYKLAFFHLLLPYWKKFFNAEDSGKLVETEMLKCGWKKNAEESLNNNNDWHKFFSEIVKKTYDRDDVVWIGDLLKRAQIYLAHESIDKRIKQKDIRVLCQKEGIEYDSVKAINRIEANKKNNDNALKGLFRGIRITDELVEDINYQL